MRLPVGKNLYLSFKYLLLLVRQILAKGEGRYKSTGIFLSWSLFRPMSEQQNFEGPDSLLCYCRCLRGSKNAPTPVR